MGLFVLFRNNNRSGTHLEIPCFELYPPDNRRPADALPRPAHRRRGFAGAFRHAAAQCKPPADELLLLLCHGCHRNSLSCRRPAKRQVQSMGSSHGDSPRCRDSCRRCQPSIALQYLRIFQGNKTLTVGTDTAFRHNGRSRRPTPHRRYAIQRNRGLELRPQRDVLSSGA